MNTPDESCLFPIQRSLKGKLDDFEVTFLVFINIAVSEIRIYNNFFFLFQFKHTWIQLWVCSNASFFYGGEPQGEALRALWNELQFKMQSYITDLWRRLGVIYRQSNSSERVVDYFEATVDRFRGTGKPNFRKFRFELMLR